MKRKPGLNILVVENHADTLDAMKMFLELDGHSVRAAETLRGAVEVSVENKFDLVITDIGLPDGDGWELMRRLQALRPVRAVAMTGYGWKEDLEKSRAAGFQAHLLKPLKVSDLEAVLRKVEREVASAAPPKNRARKPARAAAN